MGTVNKLIGQTVIKMQIADDKKALLFITENNEHLIARTDGDCCSDSWVESVELPALGFPFKIVAIESLELPGSHEDEDGDCIEVYGAKVITDKGDMVIDYRNASNGYYGGWIVWPGGEDEFYGGVHGQNVSNEVWVDIVDAG